LSRSKTLRFLKMSIAFSEPFIMSHRSNVRRRPLLRAVARRERIACHMQKQVAQVT
jgi:hypothetical protein